MDSARAAAGMRTSPRYVVRARVPGALEAVDDDGIDPSGLCRDGVANARRLVDDSDAGAVQIGEVGDGT